MVVGEYASYSSLYPVLLGEETWELGWGIVECAGCYATLSRIQSVLASFWVLVLFACVSLLKTL